MKKLMLLISFQILLTACNEDEKNVNEGDNTSLIGTWIGATKTIEFSCWEELEFIEGCKNEDNPLACFEACGFTNSDATFEIIIEGNNYIVRLKIKDLNDHLPDNYQNNQATFFTGKLDIDNGYLKSEMGLSEVVNNEFSEELGFVLNANFNEKSNEIDGILKFVVKGNISKVELPIKAKKVIF